MESPRSTSGFSILIMQGVIAPVFAALLGLSYLLGRSYGQGFAPLNIAVWLYVGFIVASRTRTDLSNSNFNLSGLAINGSILGGICYCAYEITSWLSLEISEGTQAINSNGIIVGIVEAGVISAVATLAWYAIQNARRLVDVPSSSTSTVHPGSKLRPVEKTSPPLPQSKLKVSSQMMTAKTEATVESLMPPVAPPQKSNLKVSPNMQKTPMKTETSNPDVDLSKKSKLRINMKK